MTDLPADFVALLGLQARNLAGVWDGLFGSPPPQRLVICNPIPPRGKSMFDRYVIDEADGLPSGRLDRCGLPSGIISEVDEGEPARETPRAMDPQARRLQGDAPQSYRRASGFSGRSQSFKPAGL